MPDDTSAAGPLDPIEAAPRVELCRLAVTEGIATLDAQSTELSAVRFRGVMVAASMLVAASVLAAAVATDVSSLSQWLSAVALVLVAASLGSLVWLLRPVADWAERLCADTLVTSWLPAPGEPLEDTLREMVASLGESVDSNATTLARVRVAYMTVVCTSCAQLLVWFVALWLSAVT